MTKSGWKLAGARGPVPSGWSIRRQAAGRFINLNVPLDHLLHFSDDGLSVCGIALALEPPQAAADHGEKCSSNAGDR